MKKIILPFMLAMLGFTTLMAFTISKDGTLTRETVQTDAPKTDAPKTDAPKAGGTSGIIPNSVDLVWADSYGGNTHFTTATNKGQGQYNPSRSPVAIGTSSYHVPTANMWMEVELEGTDTSCSHTINEAKHTRVETSRYHGWWMDANNRWHPMSNYHRNGSAIPGLGSLTGGLRSCTQQYFKDERKKIVNTINSTIVKPGGGPWSPETHLFLKPENYHRWHGFGGKTRFDTPQTCKAVFFQIYARLVVDKWDNPNNIDDRHKARYVIHLGSDRKGYDGTQMWDMGISRFKRVTNDWQPFNFIAGIITKKELEENPPPFTNEP